MCEQHRDDQVTLQERLLPFVGGSLPFVSAGMPSFGGSQQLVQRVGKSYVHLEDADGTVRMLFFQKRPMVLFITGTIESPPAIGRTQVDFADAELEELFEFDVDVLSIGRDFVEVFVTDRRALIPFNEFVEVTFRDEGMEE